MRLIFFEKVWKSGFVLSLVSANSDSLSLFLVEKGLCFHFSTVCLQWLKCVFPGRECLNLSTFYQIISPSQLNTEFYTWVNWPFKLWNWSNSSLPLLNISCFWCVQILNKALIQAHSCNLFPLLSSIVPYILSSPFLFPLTTSHLISSVLPHS